MDQLFLMSFAEEILIKRIILLLYPFDVFIMTLMRAFEQNGQEAQNQFQGKMQPELKVLVPKFHLGFTHCGFFH